MTHEKMLDIFIAYESGLSGILSRFNRTRDGMYMSQGDHTLLHQTVRELIDLCNDSFGKNIYSHQIANEYNSGSNNFTGSPSYRCVEHIVATVRAIITRLKRNGGILGSVKNNNTAIIRENIFIIHGQDEAKWRELKDIIQNKFYLNPIILVEQPEAGCKTIIEKFEHYAQLCSYAIAVFTPDDQVSSGDKTYLQARPNVIYELGWFCGQITRSNVMLLLKEGTSIFSDFSGIIQKRFSQNISEKIDEISNELISSGVIDQR